MCGQQVASEMSVTITLDTLLDFQPPHPHPTHNQQGCPQGGADQNSTTPTNQPQPHNRSHNQSEEQTKPKPCHTRTPNNQFPPASRVKKSSFPHQETLAKPPPQPLTREASAPVTVSRRQVKTLPTQPTTVKPQPRDPPHTFDFPLISCRKVPLV